LAASVTTLRAWWSRFRDLPGGPWLFSRLFGLAIPYSGSVRPLIRVLAPGRAVIAMRDRRAVRNHLTSVHAIALANLAEMTTGLALGYGLPDGMRTILVRVECEFLKKARGTITAACEAPVFAEIVEKEVLVESILADASGAVVAKARAVWLAGPVKA
jgi:acyl-coenzyme A thioesterase PaaI-like protein